MKTNKMFAAIHYFALVLVALIFIGPLIFLISAVFKTNEQMFRFPIEWIPNPVKWTNFQELFDLMPMWAFIRNSLVITVLSTIGTLFSCTLVAFAFARTKARSRNFWFIVLLATLMIPSQVTQIPVFIIFRELNWIDTPLPLIIPTFLGNAFYIFLIRQFFMTIPNELDEATVIDGGSKWTILIRIMIPLSIPALITVSIFTFVGSWTDFYSPLIYLSSLEQMTLSVGITFLQGQHATNVNVPLLATASLISILPIAFIYTFSQKYFVEGVVLSGIKG
ncbi:carbohydrate ABC transporter permease [Paenibacillus albiflavus]|uniref:Carbohydrate ABC transporter permease n=1 Tax=Paenibacillus albiflavus TaxID=2545760 RepID=A0A4R4EFF4_9BACL|nr:carbohydrate ABC transporter permease [Paenibacillus albiflavus]TCZ78796.1 carbohydrate ABC transporter permease [Paenibacillus albiflavus]